MDSEIVPDDRRCDLETEPGLRQIGDNKESKLAFFRYIADELKSKLSIRPDDIMINMVFVDRSDWSFGNGEPWN